MRFSDMRALFRSGLPKRGRYRWRKSKHCYWCNRGVRYRGMFNVPTQATREHIWPRSKGGGGGANVAVACRRCNNARGSDTTWLPFREVPRETRREGQAYRRIGEEITAVPFRA